MISFILSKLNKNRASLFLLAGNAIVTIVNFLIIAFFSHKLSIEINATYRQLFMFLALGSAFGNAGFAQAIYFQLNKTQKIFSDFEIISTGRFLLFSSAFFTTGLAYFLMPAFINNFSNPEFNKIAWLGLGILFFTIIQASDFSIYLYKQKVKRYFLVSISAVILKLIIAYYLYTTGFDIVYFVISILFISAFTFFYSLLILRGKTAFFNFSIKNQQVKQQIVYALPIGLAIIAGLWMTQIDKLVLNYYIHDLRSFVVLSNGSIELPFLSTLYVSFSMIAMPMMIKAYENGEINRLLEERNSYIKMIATVIIPVTIALIFWSDKIILLAFGSEYQDSAPLFALFSTILFSRICSYQDIILLTGRTKYLTYIQGIELFFHFLITVFFISNFGIMGAPIASVITHYLYVLVISSISANLLKISPLRLIPLNFILSIFAVGAVSILPFVFIHQFLEVSVNQFFWIFELIVFLVLNYFLLLFIQKR